METSTTRALSPTAARIHGAAIILGPILLLASTVAYLSEGNGINDGVLGGTIGVWSCFALVVGFAGLFRLLEPDAPRAAPILALTALTGFTAGVAFNIQAIFVAHFGPETEFVDVVEGSDTVGILAFLPWGLLTPVSLVATGILLWRTRFVAPATAALLVAGGILFVASRPSQTDPLAVAADCVLVLALAPIGWSILTQGQPTSVTSTARGPSPTRQGAPS